MNKSYAAHSISVLNASAALALALLLSSPAIATDSQASDRADDSAAPSLKEVVVTARRRSERLQDVPDSITAFTATTLENDGIEHVADFMQLTPNLTYEDGSSYRPGYITISMRGISNGQEGWPSVTYVVDGVPVSSLDEINLGSLTDVERIEVLRGPQSALYGANAIAGAINIITKQPKNQMEAHFDAGYSNGNDKRIGVSVSGPVINDVLLFRVTASYNRGDGLIDSASNGDHLQYLNEAEMHGRLIFKPADGFQVDFRLSYVDDRDGAGYQEKLATAGDIDTFNLQTDPRRSLVGFDHRDLIASSTRIQWDLPGVSLSSITGFSNLNQGSAGSLCYDDPNAPILPAAGGGAQCLFGAAYGNAALPGQAVDDLESDQDSYQLASEDLRVTSAGNQPLRWLAGASGMYRRALNGFDAGTLVAPDGSFNVLFPEWNVRHDRWWALYSQVSYNILPRLELTADARYDKNNYSNVSYTNRNANVVVPVLSPSGSLEPEQRETADAFQPKGQLSYHFDTNLMAYVTWSRGFRAGYYEAANFTLPEHTTNYEAGVKAQLLGERLTLNADVFHIDYSNQQFSQIIDAPPYRESVNIPKTRIDGSEVESNFALNRAVSLGASVGYLNARVDDGTRSPSTPKFTANLTVDFVHPVSASWNLYAHADYRFSSSMYLGLDDTFEISSKSYTNLRLGVEDDHWSVALFGRNVFDTRQAMLALSNLSGGWERDQNLPASYGIEVRYTL